MQTWRELGCVANSDSDEEEDAWLPDVGPGTPHASTQPEEVSRLRESIDGGSPSTQTDSQVSDEEPAWVLRATVQHGGTGYGRPVRGTTAEISTASSSIVQARLDTEDAWVEDDVVLEHDLPENLLSSRGAGQATPDSARSSPLSAATSDVFLDLPPLPPLPSPSGTDRPSAIAGLARLQSMHGLEGNEMDDFAPLRTFRTRKAIQLHPYMFDTRQHKHDFRAAGLRPLHIVNTPDPGSAQSPPRAARSTSDGSSEPPSSQMSFNRSQDSDTQLVTGVIRDLPPYDVADDIGEFPNPSSKRRKLAHISTKSSRQAEPLQESSQQSHALSRSQPPTPPTSRSEASSTSVKEPRRRTEFRLPRSGKRQRRVSASSTSSSSDSSVQLVRTSVFRSQVTPPHAPSARSVSTSADSDNAASEADSERHFETARKRIRGVLPASWLRIGSQALNKAKKDRRQLSSRTESGIQNFAKGVAQPRSAVQASPGHHITRFEEFSDSEQDLDSGRAGNVQLQSAMDPYNLQIDMTVDSDEMEDDTIDAMLPDLLRRDRQSPKTKKVHHGRPAHAASSQSAVKVMPTARGTRPLMPRTKHKTVRGIRVQTQRQTRLTILDVPSPTVPSSAAVPQFVRIARRETRRRGEVAKQCPFHKAVRLATQADTADAESTLDDWRQGRISRKQLHQSKSHPHGEQRCRQGAVSKQPRIDQNVPVTLIRPAVSIDATEGQNNPPSRRQLSKRATIKPSARPRDLYRPAQLQSDDRRLLMSTVDPVVPTQIQPYETLRMIRAAPSQPKTFQLERFLNTAPHQELPVLVQASGSDAHAVKQSFTISRRRTKRQPRRLSVDLVDIRQPFMPAPEFVAGHVESESSGRRNNDTAGLEAYLPGQMDFDIRPLHPETYFHSSSFLGSGDFANIFLLSERDLSRPAGYINVAINDINTMWSMWTEETGTWLHDISDIIIDAHEFICQNRDGESEALIGPTEMTNYLLRSVIRYLSNCVHFGSDNDVDGFLDVAQDFLQALLDTLALRRGQMLLDASKRLREHMAEICMYLACICCQVYTIGTRLELQTSNTASLMVMFRQTTMLAFECLFSRGAEQVVSLCEALRRNGIREAGIHDDCVSIKCIVIFNLSQDIMPGLNFSFDHLLSFLWRPRIDVATNVSTLDRVWHDLLSLQPLLDIDRNGLTERNHTRIMARPCWTLVRGLLTQGIAFCGEPASVARNGKAAYIRDLIGRIVVLVQRWRWPGSDAVLAIVYDFFAERKLMHLEGHGPFKSPWFLRHLDQQGELTIESSDMAYHAFLKALAVSIRSLCLRKDSSKLSKIVWRFLPNHGRIYRRDEEVRQVDLDALRNHHDLLCVLYRNLPMDAGVKISRIRELVDFRESHQEACRISIDAWSNLARWILSSQEVHPDTTCLAGWYQALIEALVSQYRTAQSEAEQQFESYKDGSRVTLSYDTLQMTVGANQRRLLQSIESALTAIGDALLLCPDRDRKETCLEQSSVLTVLMLFDAGQSRTIAPVLHLLKIVRAVIRPNISSATRVAAEAESQDYGLVADDDFGVSLDHTEPPETPMRTALDGIKSSISKLLSNCFGADQAIPDQLLHVLVEIWCALCVDSIRKGQMSWSDCLDVHGHGSWFRLPSTQQHAQYTPLVLAEFLNRDRRCFEEHANVFLTAWLVSLVAPGHLHRYQDCLSSALLEAESDHWLLRNLSLEYDTATGRVMIGTLGTRNASFGTVLANMRLQLDRNDHNTMQYRRECHAMLKQVMGTMKTTYQTLSQGGAAHRSHSLGATAADDYVSTVQQVVSLMQQHSADICPIDQFFMHPTTFPVPLGDPTYQIARIRSYATRLGDARGQKQLAILLQTIILNAVSNDECDLLAEQLLAALSSDDRAYGVVHGQLRRFVLTEILEGYISAASECAPAWLAVVPLLVVAGDVVAKLGYSTQLGSSEQSIGERKLLTVLTRLLVQASSASVDDMSQEHVYAVGYVFAVAGAITSFVDWLQRSSGSMATAVRNLRSLRSTSDRMLEESMASLHNTCHGDYETSDLSRYVRHNIVETLTREWTKRGGDYLAPTGQVRKGPSRSLMPSREGEMQRTKLAAGRCARIHDHVFRVGRHAGIGPHSVGVGVDEDDLVDDLIF